MDNYVFTKREVIKYLALALSILLIVSYLFYGNFIVAIILSPSIYFYFKYLKKKLLSEKKDKLKLEFCTAIESLCAPLRAGFSLENSFLKVEKDLQMMYEKDSVIVSEISKINNQVEMNINIEDALKSFAYRCKIKEIEDFAQVLSISKRADGNMIKVINFTSKIIRDEYETKRELATLLAEKKYEASIMKVMPIAILLYMKICMNNYLKALYGNVLGICIMSIVLIIYVCLCLLIDRIGKIEV